jgi:hypothetical protein
MIEHEQKKYKNNMSILVYGYDLDSKTSDNMKLARSYHKNAFFKIEHQQMQDSKVKNQDVIMKKEPFLIKNAADINKRIHEAIDTDANGANPMSLETMRKSLKEQGLLRDYSTEITSNRFKSIEKRILDMSKRKTQALIEYPENKSTKKSSK